MPHDIQRLPLVFDRTQIDVDTANETSRRVSDGLPPENLAELVAGLKGMYSAADLSRVDNAAVYIGGLLSQYGYGADVSPRQGGWNRADLPVEAEYIQYLDNIKRIVAASPGVFHTTPPVPLEFYPFTYTKANDIERILHDINLIIIYMVASFVYSNQGYSGAEFIRAELR